MLKPYYSEDGITIYNADCLEALHEINGYDTVITDPVWPNNSVKEFSRIDAIELFYGFSINAEGNKRFAVHLGLDTDPRDMLFGIGLPYVRFINLKYALPSHKGRLLNSGPIAYLFGEIPPHCRGRKLFRERLSQRALARKPIIQRL
jgi:hypothetical protein